MLTESLAGALSINTPPTQERIEITKLAGEINEICPDFLGIFHSLYAEKISKSPNGSPALLGSNRMYPESEYFKQETQGQSDREKAQTKLEKDLLELITAIPNETDQRPRNFEKFCDLVFNFLELRGEKKDSYGKFCHSIIWSLKVYWLKDLTTNIEPHYPDRLIQGLVRAYGRKIESQQAAEPRELETPVNNPENTNSLEITKLNHGLDQVSPGIVQLLSEIAIFQSSFKRVAVIHKPRSYPEDMPHSQEKIQSIEELEKQQAILENRLYLMIEKIPATDDKGYPNFESFCEKLFEYLLTRSQENDVNGFHCRSLLREIRHNGLNNTTHAKAFHYPDRLLQGLVRAYILFKVTDEERYR